MKILMVNNFYYLRGGRERCFFDLTELLEQNGHEVIPFSMDHPRNFDSPYSDYFVSNVDFPNRLEKKNKVASAFDVVERVMYSGEAKQKMRHIIADTEPDLVHVHGFMHELSPSILTPIKDAGLPIVQTLHDFKILCPNTGFISNGEVCERCKVHRYYNVVLHRCKRGSLSASMLAGVEMYVQKAFKLHEEKIDHFIAPSQFLQNKVKAYGIKKPITNIPNFTHVDQFQPCYEPDDYFVYAGRLDKVKGIDTLLDAMDQVERSHLYIAGWGENEDALRMRIAKRKVQNITFLGHLNTDELIGLIQRAAFVIVPSELYENYSMSVIESLACGTPVIGSEIGGIPEQVIDGWNGRLFQPGNVPDLANKINFMLDHPETAVKMGINARKRVEQINNPQMHYEQTLAVYQKVLQQDFVPVI
ncbi:MAG: glycosyltransferase family 4 protein [Anaerolineales bacterium]|nr:glycosyltransferase family 4 protein [Anaerolineales bacterium]